jgi:hypothetical protein
MAQGARRKAQGIEEFEISNLRFEIIGLTLRPAPCALSHMLI